MILFVRFVIKKVDDMSVLFHSEDFLMHLLYRKMAKGYRALLALYMTPKALTSVSLLKIDPRNPGHFLPIEHIHLGGSCESLLLDHPLRDGELKLRRDALQFLQELCSQLKRRFDFDPDSTIASPRVLDPAVAVLDIENEKGPRTLAPLMVHFKHLLPEEYRDELNNEWLDLPVALSTADIAQNSKLAPPVFWGKLLEVTNAADKPRFPLLTQLMA